MKQRDSASRHASLAGIGAAAILIVCCAAGPAIVAFAAGLSVAALLGAGAAVLTAIGLAAVVATALRARRRRSCRPLKNQGPS